MKKKVEKKPLMSDILNFEKSIEDYENMIKEVQKDINFSNAEKSKMTWELTEKIKELKETEQESEADFKPPSSDFNQLT